MLKPPPRAILPVCVALVSLSACKEKHRDPMGHMPGIAAPAPAPPPAPGGIGSAASNKARLAYSHDMTIRVPVGSFEQHYATLRDTCLHDQTLHCLLLSSSVAMGEEDSQPLAHVDVRLPHNEVSIFVARALRPLAGDKPGDVQTLRQSTQAEDLSQPVADATTRDAELENYRDRLTELSKRPDTKAGDLIQIERELAHTQAEIDGNKTSLRDMNTRIDTERLSLSLQTAAPQATPDSPIHEALAQSGAIFVDNLADVIRFVVAALPWVPVILGGGAILRFAVRRWKRASGRWPWQRKP